MLNQDTKRKIDSARQILVGKVPDPKAQVEQITTALIYKFMDDTDKEAQVLGGKARYFTNGYEKYAWSKIMDVRLGGHDRLNLYFEAVSNLGRNKHIPQIFRDIFGDRALPPYRDAQTLTLFLKEINGFDFEHSEDLGDAYEFLLNVIGTSGEAGQFRTPRHLIDFIAAAVDPKKNETILDPACGTAGFLISAYKHILKQHDGLDDPEKTEKPLTPDEKKSLMNHFVGYDIDPGMARIATVNMYLHNFPEPKIFEYDTLTYEDRWDETFDVILANPPFMTPKGGIRPHKRFSIQANRAEVLFVDYIADHLNINGKAGVIVPEGIIFNNQTAYKNLRKKLVEDYLIAVVSLPQGVFIKPGGKGNVKTGVLIFDKTLAKKTKDILFVKISNDGFDLGAQRRAIDKNDLPLALEIIKKYKSALKNGIDFTLGKDEKEIAHLVAKEKIAETGDYNLTGERYKETKTQENHKWKNAKINEIIDLNFGTRITKKNDFGSKYPVYGGGGESFRTDEYNRENEMVISRFAMSEICVRFVAGKFFMLDSGFTYSIKPEKQNEVLKEYIDRYFLSKQSVIYGCSRGNAQKNLDVNRFKNLEIPLPPIEVQKEIVEQIEVKQNAIDHAKAIIKNLERERRYFGQTLRKLEGVEMAKLSEVCGINQKTSEPKKLFGDSDFVYIDISSVENGTGLVDMNNVISTKSAPSRARRVIKNGDVLLSTVRPNLKAFAYAQNLPEKVLASTGFAVLTATDKILPKYIFNLLFTDYLQEQMIARMGKGSYPSINQDDVEQLTIPLPSLEIQKKLVAEAEKEQQVINANKQLIEIMEQKISEVLSEI